MPKLVTSIIFLFLSQLGLLSQNILDAPVSFIEDSLSLEDLLPRLTVQTGANFAYNKRKMPLKAKLPIVKREQTLGELLQQIFSNTSIEFRISEKQIILSRKSIPLFTISGYVRDSASGEALIGANVFESKQFLGTSANAYGFYTLTLPEGEYELKASFVGYQERTDTIFLYENLDKEILLSTGSDLLEVVVVDSLLTSGNNNIEQKQSAGTNKINTEEVEGSPSIMGEQDVMKTAQLLPGITFGVEGSSGLHVRGGSPDQNLILLDDVALYNVDHLFGLVSIFNSKAINSASIYKSGFPARYSGRLSSVMDVRMKDGNNKELHGGLSMGLISGKVFLEGPIQKGKSSFLISGRRTWLDIIAASIQLGQKEVTANYGFHDFNAKINFELSKKDRLFLSVYSGRDRFFDKRNFNFTQVFIDTISTNSINEGELKWGNKAYALRWNSVITPKLFMNAIATFGTFNYGLKSFISSSTVSDSTNTTSNDLKIESKIKDIGFKVSFDYAPNIKQRWLAGLGYTLHDFTPGSLRQIYKSNGSETIIMNGAPRVKVHESFLFLESNYELAQKLFISSGFHLSLINTNQKTFWAPQLRFKLDYQYSNKSNLELSYSGMSQFVHLLTNATLGPPTDFWVPSTENVAPEYAHQFAIGNSHVLNKNWNIKGGLFYKQMNNLIEYEQGASVINSAAEWESSIEKGKGWSYGGELLVKKSSGKTRGWLSYGLTWAKRQFENINSGKAFPYKYDRRHNLNLNISHTYIGKKNRKKEINLSWVLSSGHLVTLPDEFYRTSDGRVVAFYSKRNNFRLPIYHRLDFSKTKYKPSKNGNLHTWSWGVFNIYGRANPFNFYIENFNPSSGETRLVGQGLFSFPLPYIQYQFDF